MSMFYTLKVTTVKKETSDASTISLEIPQELKKVFEYKPGQYLTLKFSIEDKEVRRSYSLCSAPTLDNVLTIGVKRVKDGLVSNYINDTIKEGDCIEVMPPDGRFFATIQPQNYKTYYLFAAGSGITPIFSILRTVLLTEKHSYVYMIYGNKNEESILFKEALDELQELYNDRFILIHTLSRPKMKWSDLWNSKTDLYRKGRVDEKSIEWFINEYPLYAQNAEYYICGPGSMISNTQQALQNIDVPNDRIYIESFGGNTTAKTIEGYDNAQLKVEIAGKIAAITVPKGKTILRTLIDHKYEPPYSCEGGVCSTCICKLKEGKVHMKNNLVLDEKEIEEGYILSCQSIPISEKLEVVYE